MAGVVAMAVLVLLLQLVSSNPMVAHADAASVLGRKAGVVDEPAAENAPAWAREVRRHLRRRQHGEPAERLQVRQADGACPYRRRHRVLRQGKTILYTMAGY